MYELKTKENDKSVIEFIEKVESPKKREDAYKLLDVFAETTGYPAKMWGTSIIGFGSYHYKYDSGHEGNAPLVGFSPRKSKISLYFATGDTNRDEFLKNFGKHTTGKACVYINKMADINVEVLKELIKQSVEFLKEKYPVKKENKPESSFLSKLSSPARNALVHEGIETLQELSKYTEIEILKIHGIGPASLPTMRTALEEEGLSFRK